MEKRLENKENIILKLHDKKERNINILHLNIKYQKNYSLNK